MSTSDRATVKYTDSSTTFCHTAQSVCAHTPESQGGQGGLVASRSEGKQTVISSQSSLTTLELVLVAHTYWDGDYSGEQAVWRPAALHLWTSCRTMFGCVFCGFCVFRPLFACRCLNLQIALEVRYTELSQISNSLKE